ncbi:hypothetical protein EVAR_76354_1 [Eumeta japonica]|uniref:Uncharacterized protein n=1 Tax=Eumeta variegata TaxID=151549 RepID=A0A4C1TAJ4_EUMVA|nr:hypothetical protein EVAR_76354_1 [Eumeta japonica]
MKLRYSQQFVCREKKYHVLRQKCDHKYNKRERQGASALRPPERVTTRSSRAGFRATKQGFGNAILFRITITGRNKIYDTRYETGGTPAPRLYAPDFGRAPETSRTTPNCDADVGVRLRWNQ